MSLWRDETVEPAEQRWLLWIIAIYLAAISLPYLWAALFAPFDFVYQWLLYNVDDQNVHLAWARQAQEGHFFLRDLFTGETLDSTQAPLFNNLFTWLMGTLARITGAPPILFYHVLRLVFAALCLKWLHALCAQFTTDRRIRLAGVALAAFAGGAGWLARFFPATQSFFTDWPGGTNAMPEAYTFLSALIFPLFIASMALLTLIYLLVLRAQETNNWRLAAGAGATALLLGNIHTYDVLPLDVVMLAWAAWSWKTTKNRNRMTWLAPIIVIGSTLPPLFYQVFVFFNSAEFQIKALTRTAPPPLFSVLLSYGPLLLLALVGAWHWRKNPRAPLIMLWLVVTLLCIFAPVSFGRKMIEGAHLPLCLLAGAGLVALAQNLRAPFSRRVAVIVILGISSFSSLNFALWCLENAAQNNRERDQFFLPPPSLETRDVAALEFLKRSPIARDKAVLSLPYLGNYIPQKTGRVVFAGHWAETLNFFDPATRSGKLTELQRFYGIGGRQMSADEARAWLQKNRIGLVVLGDYEKRWGATLPLKLPLLQSFGGTKFSGGVARVEIYRVLD